MLKGNQAIIKVKWPGMQLRLFRVEQNSGYNSLYVGSGKHRSEWFRWRVVTFYKAKTICDVYQGILTFIYVYRSHDLSV